MSCYVYCYGCYESQKRSLKFLWVLVSSSILLVCTLPTLGSGNSAGSVISKTNGTVNRMKSNTHPTPTSLLRFIDHSLVMEKGLISMKL